MKKHYKTELHTHTTPVSRCSDISPKQLVEIYKRHGYDSVVLTNHFTSALEGETVEEKVNRYLDDYYQCLEEGTKVGLNVVLGAEIKFTENKNEYLIYGINPDDLVDIYNRLTYGIDQFYREYKNAQNIIIQAHPFRDGMELVNPKSLDGVEVFNVHPHHNSRNGLAAKFANENGLIATCGNDFHHLGHECLCGILTEKPLKNSFDVAEVLKNREFIMSVGEFLIR